MSLSPNFEKICLSNKAKTQTTQVKVQTKTEILTEEIKRILNISTQQSIYTVTSDKENVKGNGKVVFYVCYENMQGQIRKCETPEDFEFDIPLSAEGCKLTARVKTEKVEADVNGIKLELKAVMGVNVDVRECIDCQALVGGENLVCDLKEFELKRGLGIKKIVYPIEEEFELPYAIEEVMFHRAEPVITSAQCGVGCIIVDGEVRLSAILLQKQDKRIIIKESRKMPFRAEIEYEEAMPALSAVAKVDLKSFKTDITVDGEQQKSLVTASVMLSLEGEASATESVNLAVDVFSTTDNTEIERGEACFIEQCELRSAQYPLTVTVDLTESEQGKTLKAVGGERVEIVSLSPIDDKLSVGGIVCFTGYFEGEENTVFTRKMETPFEAVIDANLPVGCKIHASGQIECQAFNLTEQAVTLTCNLTLTVYPETECSCRYISGVSSKGEKQRENSAISVYLATEGEELWSLCKKLNQTPEQITKTNQELVFPLKGSERIVVYRQK